jgi:hypothetical protein
LVKRYFKNQFVTHREINILHFAVIELYGSQCGMIEFGTIEIAIGKRTLNKSNSNKITSGKITVDKLTGFKFFEVHFLFTISGVLVGQIKEVCCHS